MSEALASIVEFLLTVPTVPDGADALFGEVRRRWPQASEAEIELGTRIAAANLSARAEAVRQHAADLREFKRRRARSAQGDSPDDPPEAA